MLERIDIAATTADAPAEVFPEIPTAGHNIAYNHSTANSCYRTDDADDDPKCSPGSSYG